MADDSDEDKQHEPTQKKLDDARKKGDIPRSQDLTTAAAYGGLLIALAVAGSQVVRDGGTALLPLLAQPNDLIPLFFEGSSATLAGGLMTSLLWSLGPLFLVPALAALLAIIAQRSFVVAPEKLMPKLSRISPLENAKNKFGRSGLFEFTKSFVKLLVFSVAMGFFLVDRLPDILHTLSLSPGMSSTVLGQLCIEFLAIVLVISGVIGGIDFFWQRQEHLRKNRMSHKELTDEAKQAEGDPHMKQQRRQRGHEIAMNKMIAEVPTADVVIVNPTHYAVALKWDRSTPGAPECVAKGVDNVAARIREIAQENAVPIHSDPPTARALYASVNLGEEIAPEHYKPVAAAIRFAEAMREKARKSWSGRA